MAKKGLLVLVLAALVVGGAFAQAEFRLSAGVGGYFTSDFGGGYKMSLDGMAISTKLPYVGFGGFAFFDATYAELSFGFFGTDGAMVVEADGASVSTGLYYTGLDISLYGKYPFVISDKLSLFPLLGVSYRVIVGLKDDDGNDADEPGDMSALWFRLGGGLDYSFTDSIYLRAGILYGIRLGNQFEADLQSAAKDLHPNGSVESLLGHGLEVKVAVGFRF